MDLLPAALVVGAFILGIVVRNALIVEPPKISRFKCPWPGCFEILADGPLEGGPPEGSKSTSRWAYAENCPTCNNTVCWSWTDGKHVRWKAKEVKDDKPRDV